MKNDIDAWQLLSSKATSPVLAADPSPDTALLSIRPAERAGEPVLADRGIEITGRLLFTDIIAIFIGDPDRNVIELDEYPGDDPASRLTEAGEEIEAYKGHP